MHRPALTDAQRKALAQLRERQGARLRRLRTALGLSQTEAAREAGISKFKLNHMEGGRAVIDPLALQMLCEAHEISADYVILASGLTLPGMLRDKLVELETQEIEQGLRAENLDAVAPDLRDRVAALKATRNAPDQSRKRKQRGLGAVLAVVA